MEGFPKWQISKFFNGSKDVQAVFRTNNKEEYEEQLKEWTKTTPIENTQAVERFEEEHEGKKKFCPVHGTEMEEHISKKTGKPYHSHKDDVGAMCFGKGSLPPLDKSKYGQA